MIKQYEVEEIITRALEELNGVFSKPDENGNRSLYEATVEDKGNGILECYFKEDMLVERKFILDDSSKVIGQLLGINPDDIVECCDCGKVYTKEMVSVLTEDDEDYEEDWTQYRCFYCQDVKNLKEGNPHATDYYRNILKELDEYKEAHPINNEEE